MMTKEILLIIIPGFVFVGFFCGFLFLKKKNSVPKPDKCLSVRTQDLATLYNISKAIGSSLDFELMISRAMDELAPLLQLKAYTVLVPDDKGKFYPRINRSINKHGIKVEEHSDLLTEVQKNGQITFADNIIIVPLRTKLKTLGILMMLIKEKQDDFRQRNVNLLGTVADQLAIALENVDIFEKEKEAVARLAEIDTLKNEFISMVSHELRTPVTSIDGYVSLFLTGSAGEITKEQEEYLTIVKDNSRRLITLITRMLDFSRMETGRFEVEKQMVSINEIIQSVADDLAPQLADQKAKLNLRLEAKQGRFIGDEIKISEVITNLVENALKFKLPKKAAAIDIITKNEGSYIRVEVIDNGIGIEEDHLHKIFNKFFQVEQTLTRRIGGVGLGLTIVKEIIANHHGKIWAESEGPNKGTKFVFILPVAERK